MAKRPFWMVSLALLLAVSTVAILHAPPNATRAAANSAVVSGPANTAAYLPAKQDGIAETIVEFNESATPAGGDGGPPTEIVGFLREHHGDDFDNSHVVEGYLVDTDSGPVEVIFPPGLQLAPGQRVRLRGAFSGNTFVVTAGGPESAGGGTIVAATTGAKTVAVILFNFSINASQPYTQDYARGIAFLNNNSVANYYAENSWGQLALSGEVFGWYTIPDTNTSCNYSAWATSADQQATAAGVNLSAYTYKVYAFPSTSSCKWSGLAYLPGTKSWLNGTGAMGLRVMSHELGHNFGTHHSSSLSCTESGSRVSLSANSANCPATPETEYADPFSVMGSASTRHHTNFSRGNFGWLTATNTQDVLASGTYNLAPSQGYNPGGVQALRILRATNSYLLLEFRQPYGTYFDNFSSTDPVVNGVTVRVTPGYSTLTQSKLVDATPATTSFSDAPIGVGKSLYDPLRGVTIITQSVSLSGAVVQVTFEPDTSTPTAPTSLVAAPLDPSRVSLTWTGSTDNVGVAGYRVYRNGSSAGTTTSTSYTDSGLQQQTTYTYDVEAFDSAGNVSPKSNTATATTPLPDTTTPSVPTNLTASVAKSKSVSLAWDASTDNMGVTGYRVFRNGAQVAQVTGTAWSNRPGRGTFTYTVVAYDAAGLVSTASNSVSVTI